MDRRLRYISRAILVQTPPARRGYVAAVGVDVKRIGDRGAWVLALRMIHCGGMAVNVMNINLPLKYLPCAIYRFTSWQSLPGDVHSVFC